jgi:hypothetical protein
MRPLRACWRSLGAVPSARSGLRGLLTAILYIHAPCALGARHQTVIAAFTDPSYDLWRKNVKWAGEEGVLTQEHHMVYLSNETVTITDEQLRRSKENAAMFDKLTAGMSQDQLRGIANAGGPIEMLVAIFKAKLPNQSSKIDEVVSQWRVTSGIGGQETTGPDGSAPTPTPGMGILSSLGKLFR